MYWAIQAGLLTPLTFARHRLSPLAAFTSVRTFFTMEGGDSEFSNFTLPTLKAFFEACSDNVSGNKQQLVVRALRCPKTHFFLRTRDLLISPKTTQRHFLFTLHPLSTAIFATATVLAFLLLRNSNFNCYTQHEVTPTQKSARKCAATSRNFFR